jgi:polyisoprenoid-binding protein YceI
MVLEVRAARPEATFEVAGDRRSADNPDRLRAHAYGRWYDRYEDLVSHPAPRPPARVTVRIALLAALVASVTLRSPGSAPAEGSAPARYAIVAEASEVRYRVREQLAGLNFPNDAVGTTNAIVGAIVLDAQGRVVPGDSRFTVDLRTLKSDEARRDGYLQRNTLETEKYPTVTFVATEAQGLPFPLPRTGSVPFQLMGDLTVKDATRRVAWTATASFAGPRVTVQARTAFRFGDFGLQQPRVRVLLSVDDEIKLEADLTLRRGS